MSRRLRHSLHYRSACVTLWKVSLSAEFFAILLSARPVLAGEVRTRERIAAHQWDGKPRPEAVKEAHCSRGILPRVTTAALDKTQAALQHVCYVPYNSIE